MPRTARSVLEGIPYHVTQRGNRRGDVFFCDQHRVMYLDWLREYADRYGLDLLAYSLMTNHVHVIGIPQKADSLARTLHALNTRYARTLNAERLWVGHLWQGRYFSCALDEAHLQAAVRYVERNPVRAGMVARAEEYLWSSAAFHLGLREDGVIRSETEWGSVVEDWAELLRMPEDPDMVDRIRKRTLTGYPCGDDAFVAKVSKLLGRDLVLRPRGRPRRNGDVGKPEG